MTSCVGRQPPRHGAAVPFGPSGDRGAEAVDHARELQRRFSSRRSRAFSMRELLDAGGQQPVHPLLPPEVVAVVLDQPAHERQQQPLLDEHDRRADDRSMTGKPEARVETPLLVVGQQFRQEDGALAALDGASEHLVDGGEELGVAVGQRRRPRRGARGDRGARPPRPLSSAARPSRPLFQGKLQATSSSSTTRGRGRRSARSGRRRES